MFLIIEGFCGRRITEMGRRYLDDSLYQNTSLQALVAEVSTEVSSCNNQSG